MRKFIAVGIVAAGLGMAGFASANDPVSSSGLPAPSPVAAAVAAPAADGVTDVVEQSSTAKKKKKKVTTDSSSSSGSGHRGS